MHRFWQAATAMHFFCFALVHHSFGARAHTDCAFDAVSFIKSKRMFIIMSLESRFIIFNVIINFYFCASTFFVLYALRSEHAPRFYPSPFIHHTNRSVSFAADYYMCLLLLSSSQSSSFFSSSSSVFHWFRAALFAIERGIASCSRLWNAMCPHSCAHREIHNYHFFFLSSFRNSTYICISIS